MVKEDESMNVAFYRRKKLRQIIRSECDSLQVKNGTLFHDCCGMINRYNCKHWSLKTVGCTSSYFQNRNVFPMLAQFQLYAFLPQYSTLNFVLNFKKRRKRGQNIIKDYVCLWFYLLFILCGYLFKH
jgi:hypothetical protein